jgi:hypothetical protein
MNEFSFTQSEIRESRQLALEQIKKFLDADDVNGQFNDRSGEYHSADKFIVSWKGNYNRMPSEFSIDKVDSFFNRISGSSSIYATRSLFHEKQLNSFETIERALLVVGLKLCTKKQKKDFFNKYVVKYNAKLQQDK